MKQQETDRGQEGQTMGEKVFLFERGTGWQEGGAAQPGTGRVTAWSLSASLAVQLGQLLSIASLSSLHLLLVLKYSLCRLHTCFSPR